MSKTTQNKLLKVYYLLVKGRVEVWIELNSVVSLVPAPSCNKGNA